MVFSKFKFETTQEEIESFETLKYSIVQMLTLNFQSKFNTRKSLKTLLDVKAYTEEQIREVFGNATLSDKKDIATAFIEQDGACLGKYLMEHDRYYIVGSCFHIRLFWIQARSPTVK